jgi:hypothetical protein
MALRRRQPRADRVAGRGVDDDDQHGQFGVLDSQRDGDGWAVGQAATCGVVQGTRLILCARAVTVCHACDPPTRPGSAERSARGARRGDA